MQSAELLEMLTEGFEAFVCHLEAPILNFRGVEEAFQQVYAIKFKLMDSKEASG